MLITCSEVPTIRPYSEEHAIILHSVALRSILLLISCL